MSNRLSEGNQISNNGLQQEPKTYINLYCCQLSVGIIVTYSYMIISVLMNIVNRVLFHTYYFRFNFTLMFLQQFFCMISFLLVSKTNKFKEKAGEVSFSDFLELKGYYFSFASLFICNNLAGFYGNQLIVNTPMFLTLRKLLMVMLFFYDVCFSKKKINAFLVVCIFLVACGSFIGGIEDFTADYIGYIVVIIYNSLTVLYNKFTETFKKRTGTPNLKLLVYNSFLSCPILFILIFVSGEYKKLMNYFMGEKPFEGSYFGLFVYTFMSCGFCVCLILSFFTSNEKNSSLFTTLLSNCKDIMITVLGYFWLKGNKFTFLIITGLLMSTTGAVMIAVKTLMDNIAKKKVIGLQEEKLGEVSIEEGSKK